jgi:hypothetical protein
MPIDRFSDSIRFNQGALYLSRDQLLDHTWQLAVSPQSPD